MARRKTIGYLQPKYYHITERADSIPAVRELIQEYTEKAKHMRGLPYFIKYAALYFTYRGKCYCIHPGTLDTSNEVFERLERELTDRLYALGAYDMFYSGMLD